MTELLIVLGVVVFSVALRSFNHRMLRKIGALGVLAASFLAFYLPTDSVLAGVGGLMIWFMLPWVGILSSQKTRHNPAVWLMYSEGWDMRGHGWDGDGGLGVRHARQ